MSGMVRRTSPSTILIDSKRSGGFSSPAERRNLSPDPTWFQLGTKVQYKPRTDDYLVRSYKAVVKDNRQNAVQIEFVENDRIRALRQGWEPMVWVPPIKLTRIPQPGELTWVDRVAWAIGLPAAIIAVILIFVIIVFNL